MYRKGADNCFGNILLHFELKLALKNFDTNQQQHKKYAPCHTISESQAHWAMENGTLCSPWLWFLSMKYFTLYQHLIHMFYERICIDLHNSLCNYCILTTTRRFWYSNQKHCSVQQIFYKPLPIDQHTTLQKAIVRNKQNNSVLELLHSFYSTYITF